MENKIEKYVGEGGKGIPLNNSQRRPVCVCKV